MHADFSDRAPANIVNLTLFADGFVRYSVSPVSLLEAQGRTGLQILAVDSRIIGNTVEQMGWKPRSDVFEMHLSKEVPLAIRDQRLLGRSGPQ